jgi:ribosomal protein L37AE/L43A
VAIGTAAYVCAHTLCGACAGGMLAPHEAVHKRVRLLQSVSAECFCDPTCESGSPHGASGARVWTCDRAAWATGGGSKRRWTPLEAHDEQVRRTLSALLQRCSVCGTLWRDARRASLILRCQCLFRLHYRV